MKTTLKYSILFLCFLVVGYLTSDIFYTQSLAQLKSDNTAIISSSLNGQFGRIYIYCIAVGSIPLLYLFTHLIAKLQSGTQSIVVYSIIIFTGLVFWQLRINYLNEAIQPFSKSLAAMGILNSIDADNLKFGNYVLFGLLAGSIISSGMFKLINMSRKSVGDKSYNDIQPL